MIETTFEAVHEDLRSLKQFCIRAGKQPFIKDGTRNTFTPSGWSIHRENWLTFPEALEALERRVKVPHMGSFQPVDGIGFLVSRNEQEGPQTIGGDLDCCRDPETGMISPWATTFLQEVKPFYTELSPSKCGVRFFLWGRLPGDRRSVFGNGPQDDLPRVIYERILAAKPSSREKLAKGKPAFSGLELYESGRHLTITGERLDEFCFSKEDQTVAFREALEPFLVDEAMGDAVEGAKREGRGGLPHLDILTVIDTKGFAESGGQLFGPHPALGSTTGRNLVVNPSKNVYCYMHNGLNAGGDPWTWLACECGAVPWAQAGAGVLKDANVVKQTLEHAVKRGLVSEEILESRRCERACGDNRTGAEPRREAGHMNRPDIVIEQRHYDVIGNEVLAALVATNDPPTFFTRLGGLVQLHKTHAMTIKPLTLDDLYERLCHVANYYAIDGRGDPIVSNLPTRIAKNILAAPSWPSLPEIERIVETPVIRPDGTLLLKAGYDPATKLYLDPVIDFSDMRIPEELARAHAEASARFIMDEIFCDFPFEDVASKANTIALLVSVVARPLIDGNVPLFIIDKPQAGTGASLMLDIISQITHGKPADMGGAPSTDDEWRKSITADLMEGKPIIVKDNVVGKLKSASLARALTSKIWSDRLLGQNVTVNLPQQAVWIATGNGISVGGDIARRSVEIRLISDWARPWERTEFKHPQILEWVGEHQRDIIAHILIIIRAWYLAGHRPGARTLGSFESWAKTVSGILEFAGVEGFMANAAKFYDDADDEVAEWDAFLGVWSALYPVPMSSGELFTRLGGADSNRGMFLPIENETAKLQAVVPGEIADILHATKGGGVQGLGKVLRKHKDQMFPSGRKLTRSENTDKKIALWGVETTKIRAQAKSVYITGNQCDSDEAAQSRCTGSTGYKSIPYVIPEKSVELYRLELLPVLPVNRDAVQHGENSFPVTQHGAINENENVAECGGKENAQRHDTVKSASRGVSGGMGKIVRETPASNVESPGLQKFKTGMKKRTCCLCNRSFPYNLTPYFANGRSGFICSTCHMQGPPQEAQGPQHADPQTTLPKGGDYEVDP